MLSPTLMYVLQERLMPFVTELITFLAQKLEKLKEDLREDAVVSGPDAALRK